MNSFEFCFEYTGSGQSSEASRKVCSPAVEAPVLQRTILSAKHVRNDHLLPEHRHSISMHHALNSGRS